MALATLSIDLEARLARLESDLGRAARISERRADEMSAAFVRVREVAASIGSTLVGAVSAGAVVAFVRQTGEAAMQVKRLAELAGASTEEFQRYAAGAKSAGVDTDKFADIVKDTQDKIGDFLATGGGELKDFFEQVAPRVGVTAEQFRNLSGPQALQLFYSTLERANVGQKEAIFFMEGIADEASLLIPLLRDSGAGFQEMGDQAQRAGAIMSDETLAAGVELGKQVKELDQNVEGLSNKIKIRLIPTLNELFETFKGKGFVANLAENVGKQWDTMLAQGAADRASTKYKGLVEDIARVQDAIDRNPSNVLARNQLAYLQAQLPEIRAEATRTAEALKAVINGPAPSAGGGRGFVNPALVTPDAPTPWVRTPEPEKPKGPSGAQRYLETLQKQGEKLQDLTGYQQALKEIEGKRLEGLTPALERQILSQAAANDVTEQARFFTEQLQAAEQRRVDTLLALEASTPTAKLEMQRDLVAQITAAYESERYGIVGSTEAMQRYSEVVQTALGTLPEQWAKSTDEMEKFSDRAAKNVQEGFGESIKRALTGDFASIADLWKSMLATMVAEAIAADLSKSLFSSSGGSGGSGGGWFSTAMSFLFSANGNAFDSSGRVSYFADGGVFSRPTAFAYGAGQLGVLGEVGPEAVMPLRRGRDGKLGVVAQGGQQVVIQQTMHFGSDVSRSELARWGEAVKQQTLSAVYRGRTRDGAFA